MSSNNFSKDADSVLDYKIDWSDWLNGDVILSSTWEAVDGITIESNISGDNYTIVVLSGGTDQNYYIVTNEITTVNGLTEQASIIIFVRQK